MLEWRMREKTVIYTVSKNKEELVDDSSEEQNKVFNSIIWASVFNEYTEVILFLNLGLLIFFVFFFHYKSIIFAF